MRKFLHVALAVSALPLVGSFAAASPVVVEPTATLQSPDPAFTLFARHVAVDGDDALALAEQTVSGGQRRAVFWFHKTGTAWVFKRKLADVVGPANLAPTLALRNGVAAFIGDRLRVYEYTGVDFVEAPVSGVANGPNLTIDDGRILASDTSTCEWDANFFTKVGTTWTATQRLDGAAFPCSANMPGGGIASAYNTQFIGQPFTTESEFPTIGLYYGANPQRQALWLNGRRAGFNPDVATNGSGVYVASSPRFGVEHIWIGAEDWVLNGIFRPLDSFMSSDTRTVRIVDGGYLLQNTWGYDRAAWVVNLFGRRGSEPLAHFATLVAPKGASLGTRLDYSGSRAIVSGLNGTSGVNVAYVFDLPATFPATPATLQDSFQSGNAAGWTTLPGSQFSIATDGRTKVWRQSNVGGYAGAVFDGSDRDVQGVQAEVIRRSTDGTDRWLAVMTRYSDDGSYYYASLRDTNRVELRKIVNGRFTLIASAPFTVGANHQYRLQLVSNRDLHQVFVDGRKVLQAIDSSITHGRAGIRTYKTAADFDNVVVTGRGHTTIYRTDFSNGWLGDGVYGDKGQWVLGTHRAGQLSQRSSTVWAQTAAGPRAGDQVVQARITPDGFGTAPSGEQPWFGLYTQNYFLAVSPNNQMRLLKKFSWGYQVMGTITFTLPTVQREYRLELIGNVIRAYVDGRAMLEAVDNAFPADQMGDRGLVTNYAQASFDDFLAYQP